MTSPQLKFCQGVAKGLNQTEAYLVAYPKSGEAAARRSAARLMTNDDVLEEIRRIRGKAEMLAGSAVMEIVEKRQFLARVVRCRVGELAALEAGTSEHSDLWASIKVTERGTEYRLPCKLAAIRLDNDLAGEGKEAGGNDALADLLRRI